MGLSNATLAGHRVTSARVNVPAWGCWYADVSIDGEFALSGAQSLVVADLTLKGTVLSGGPAKGRSSFRLVAGAAGWGKQAKKTSYADDGGVKVATILGDAAAAVGETLGTIDPTLRVGPSFTRRSKDPAGRVLELVAPGAWYVDEAGVTQLGARVPGKLPAGVTHGPVDVARGTVTLASESIAAILPGIVVDGLTAVDVQHDISAKTGLRSTIWGATPAGTSRALAAFRAILEQLDPNRAFRGVTEYRVVTASGNRFNLQPVRVSTGMPDLLRVPAWPGVTGADCSKAALGSRVLVGFIDSDPSRPYVAGFEDVDGAGFLPTSLALLGGTAGVVRVGDSISISIAQFAAASAANGAGPVAISAPLAGTVTSGSTKVKCG